MHIGKYFSGFRSRGLIARIALHLAGVLLAGSIFFRFVYVLDANPLDHLFSDPYRHWENARSFFNPNLFGGMDPLIYQAYLGIVLFITKENHTALAIATGLLSALMAWFWYKALLELVSVGWARVGGICIALMPALIMIYSYFMIETLLLTLSAAALWLSYRAFRLGTFRAFIWAALIWGLTCYTRNSAVPIAGVFMVALCFHQRRQILERLVLGTAIFGLLMIPACWHSMKILNFCAPFGYSKHAEIMNMAQVEASTFYLPPNYTYHFGMCITHNRPLAPFSQWTYGARGTFIFNVDLKNGRKDWDFAVERAKLHPDKPYTPLEKLGTRFLSLFFDPSWPDNNQAYWMGWLGVQSRWAALPMFILTIVLGVTYGRRIQWEKLMLPGATVLLFMLMIGQSAYALEGRYRKFMEPMLIASCVLLLYERRRIKVSAPCHKHHTDHNRIYY